MQTLWVQDFFKATDVFFLVLEFLHKNSMTRLILQCRGENEVSWQSADVDPRVEANNCAQA